MRSLHLADLPRLSEVRKQNPKLAEAAVFVEGLFGRPILTDPRVICFPTPLVSHNGGFISPGAKTSSMVHELTHLQDISNEPKPAGKMQFVINTIKIMFSLQRRMYLEGRAVFASQLSQDKIRRFETSFFVMATGAGFLAAIAFDILPKSLDIISPLMLVQGTMMLVQGAIYWPFHNALCTLAKKFGDPIKAFRLTELKPPSLLGTLFPTKYYWTEIEAEKQIQ